MTSALPVAVVGGGIGGMATALALGQAGVNTHIYEQSARFEEAGAGIGLGPNAVRRLDAWGVGQALRESACMPQDLLVRNTEDARVLGCLPMADAFEARYGAPYLTIHRADLHDSLWQALRRQSTCDLTMNQRLREVLQTPAGVELHFENSELTQRAQALVGADGLHSQVRHSVCGEQAPVASGHWAYRALLPMKDIPLAWRKLQMGIWLGSGLHVVHYPVRGGEWLNLVVLVEATDTAATAGWDVSRTPAQIAADLQWSMQSSCHALKELVAMVQQWRAWCLFDRPPVRSAAQLVAGKVVLLGDAAHPMLPYLAQGAGMALEDAAQLAAQWQHASLPVEQRLQGYAQARWQRVARVQQRARRNGKIFHAQGWLRLARNTAMALGGAKLMDMPWLYGG